MMLWVTVDGSGSTKILACSLMMDESLESAEWSCQCFNDCFRVPPAVIFSDSAPALKAALARVFPTSMHLYFDADLTAFRTTFRMDGQSKIAAPIAPAKGNATMSPFVQLGAR
jgi:hypothetical protein